MRLLNTASLELTEFWDNEIPPYAILSHTWLKEEVSFQDMQNDNAKNKAGYAKILGSCHQAKLDKWTYLWIDTCCIDKSSSAELTEAINSMYRWYEDARICYVYLSDVELIANEGLQNQAFARSRWFTRGWTLQELLAPQCVEFYSSNWQIIGRKSTLVDQISVITGVPTKYLKDKFQVSSASVACRMSWASRRVTTRAEDMAYCLLGIFRINMPLLYGEGQKAFVRLQEEIIKTLNDHSIFAWIDINGTSAGGMFADSPNCFSNSRNIVGTVPPTNAIPAVTNCGLRLELVLVPQQVELDGTDHLQLGNIAVLYCVDLNCPDRPIGIRLKRNPSMDFGFIRIQTHLLFTVNQSKLVYGGDNLKSEVIYVHDDYFGNKLYPLPYRIDPPYSESIGSFYLLNIHPSHMWTPYNPYKRIEIQ